MTIDRTKATDAVESSKDKLKHARALIQAVLSELRDFGDELVDPEDPYSFDIDDISVDIADADISLDNALTYLTTFKGESDD